ncbi:hypothetical protein JCGZ_04130 [Jatropha curcas]|uniref:Uncharacterized protein n=1 Tax=Jatropha curcas TaxID=180498 RepID=A0A067JA07_JATCU|nr:hypothetical protein JCGZ_04130 [Jatropha curcas]
MAAPISIGMAPCNCPIKKHQWIRIKGGWRHAGDEEKRSSARPWLGQLEKWEEGRGADCLDRKPQSLHLAICCASQNRKERVKERPKCLVDKREAALPKNRGAGGSTRFSNRRMSQLSCTFCVRQRRKRGEKGGQNPLRRGGGDASL